MPDGSDHGDGGFGDILRAGASSGAFGLPGIFANVFAGDGSPSKTTDDEVTAERLIQAVFAGNGLTPDFTNSRVATAIADINEMLALGQPVQAAVSYLNTFFAPDFESGELLVASGDGNLPPGPDPFNSRAAGLTEEQVIQQFEVESLEQGFKVLVGPNGIQVKNPTGKLIAEFELGEDGLYRPVFDRDASTGGGGAAGRARSIFEDTRDFAEDVFRDRRDTEESNRRFDLGFDEDITQNRLQEGRLNRADVGSLGVQLGELNLRMQQHIAQILREPADFLARAFAQRGSTSPFPEITQADLINQLRTEFQRIRDFTAEQLGLNSDQIAQLPSPSNDAVDRVATALAPAAELITKEVQTREAVSGGGGGGGGLTFTPTRDAASEEDLAQLGRPLAAEPTFTSQLVDFDPSEFGEPSTERPSGFLGGFLNTQPAAPSNFLSEPEPTFTSQLVGFDEAEEFEHGTPVKNKPDKKGGADNELSLVGEAGPELMINHGDGSFDIISNDDLMGLMQTNKKKKTDTDKIQAFAEGTLGGLTPDDLGRLSLFDVVDVRQTTQGELESNALLATPPGPASVLSGTKIPDLDVAGGSGFKLFSPQQFDALTPDEQVALRTRLASKNRSLTDFLFASQRAFAGTGRRRPRAVFDVTR